VSPAVVRFALLLAVGFLAAAATGKLVPHVRWLAETYDVSLGLAGFAVSAVMLPGAALSAGMGLFTDRFGAKAVTVSGLVVAGAASLLLGQVAGFWPLVIVRLAEGIGYSLLVVGATVLVVEVTTAQRRTLALAVWSSFAPIGFALGQWAAAFVQGADRLAVIGMWHGALLLGAASVAYLALPGVRPATTARGTQFEALRHRPALLASLAFGSVTGVLLAAVAVAPLIVAEVNGLSVGSAAQMTAIAALPGIAGRFAAGWLLGRHLTPRAVLVAAGLSGTAAIALALLAGLPLGPSLVLFATFQVLVGIIPGVLSAMIPLVSPAPDRLGSVSGMVNQMVTLGNLIGPPLVLSIYAAADAGGAVMMLAAWTALCVALVARLAVFGKAVA